VSNSIRVLLAGLPRMLRDIVATVLASQADIVVVGTVPEMEDLAHATGLSNANIIVLGLEGAELPAACTELLCAHPSVTVLGVTGDGRQAIRLRMRPERAEIGEVSPQGLVDAIRAAASSNICRVT
jgi:DNA-binding NarL/FixJ family response regulator